MIFISGALLLLGGLTALLLNITEGCGSLASTLLFLATVAGGILLVCGIRTRKGLGTPVLRRISEKDQALHLIRQARSMVHTGVITEEQYEGMVREYRRRFML